MLTELEKILPKLPLLSPPERKALAIVLHKGGFSTRTLEDYFQVDHSTIAKWAKEDVNDEEGENIKLFSVQMELLKQKALALAVDRITEIMPKEENLEKIIKAAQYLEDKQEVNQNNVQVNNNFPEIRLAQKEKYGI